MTIFMVLRSTALWVPGYAARFSNRAEFDNLEHECIIFILRSKTTVDYCELAGHENVRPTSPSTGKIQHQNTKYLRLRTS